MPEDVKSQLEHFLNETLQKFPPQVPLPPVDLEIPADKSHGDYSSSVALKNAKQFKKAPVKIAEEMRSFIQGQLISSSLKGFVEKIEIKGPGFINFFLSPSAKCSVLNQILREKERFGRSDYGKGTKVQIEFVSANPTGPLSVAHARQAAVGDALANIFNFIGFKTDKEFYVNDEGNQINILGQSVRWRGVELLGGKVDFPEDCYQGEYIKYMAAEYLKKNEIKDRAVLEKEPLTRLSQFGVDVLLNIIKKELNDFGVHFDVWSYQSKIAREENVKIVLDELQKKGFVYEKDGALWFKSTDFGDDKDRVVKKSDGSYTYLSPDIVYHKNKFERGYKQIFNIWGPDHHGYIPRIKAAVAALGYDKDNLEVLIVQLATIFRNGQEVSMSTRRGQYISLREVMDEVGIDAARFFFLMRHIKMHLEFDLDLAKKETPENPVFYIQYAYARINSINKKARDEKVSFQENNFELLKEEAELDLVKTLSQFPDILIFCYEQRDPYPLVSYLQELATTFHRFYDRERVIVDEKSLAAERLGLVNATKIVLANGLRLLGLSTPEKM